jgi:hypothetical protein
VVVREGGQQVPAAAAVGGRPAEGLAVHGDHPETLRCPRAQRRPGTDDQVQTIRVDFVDRSSDRRLARNFTGDAEHDQNGGSGVLRPFGDGDERPGTGDHCAGRDRQDRGQSVPQSSGFAGIGHGSQRGQQRGRRGRNVGELVLVELVNNGIGGR